MSYHESVHGPRRHSICSEDEFSPRNGQIQASKEQSVCPPFEIADDPVIGRHFIATRDIEPLELVFRDLPLVVGPATKYDRPVCLECLKPVCDGVTEHSCPGCHFPVCSSDCRDSLGKLHSHEECLHIQHCPMDERNGMVYACIFILRAWLLPPGKYKSMMQFMAGDVSDLADSSSVGKQITKLMQETLKVPKITKDDILNIMGIKRTNANSLKVGGRHGTILYSLYPLMNSHCYCNTRYTISERNFELEVRAQRFIPRGSQITTRYVSAFECQPERQEKIWKNWKFICHCQRCQDPTELGTFFSGIRCQDCHVGILLPAMPDVRGSPWSCSGCGGKIGHTAAQETVSECRQHLLDQTQTFHESLSALHKLLHTGHFLVFCLKERMLKEKPWRDSCIDGVREKIALIEELLQTVETLDPGYTIRRGNLLKILAKERVKLVKLCKSKAENAICVSEEAERAVEELKIALKCLKY